MTGPITPFKRFHRLAEAAALLGVLSTLAALLGRYLWFLELFTHIKPHLACCFFVYAGLELLAHRHRHAVAGLLFAGVNAVPVLLLFLPDTSQATQPDSEPVQLRILQANILTGNTNSAALFALISLENPDVVVLQEPNRRWLHQLSSLTNRYPVFATCPRDDNFGAAIYCRSNALSAHIFQLGSPGSTPVSHARVAWRGRTVTVAGVHPLAPCNRHDWQGRNTFTRDLARTFRDTEGPLVVTGDFNNTPWSAHFVAFLKISGLRDSAQGRGPQATWPTTTCPWMRIPLDHCFHSHDVRVISKRPGPPIGSDHLPLIIDVAF